MKKRTILKSYFPYICTIFHHHIVINNYNLLHKSWSKNYPFLLLNTKKTLITSLKSRHHNRSRGQTEWKYHLRVSEILLCKRPSGIHQMSRQRQKRLPIRFQSHSDCPYQTTVWTWLTSCRSQNNKHHQPNRNQFGHCLFFLRFLKLFAHNSVSFSLMSVGRLFVEEP